MKTVEEHYQDWYNRRIGGDMDLNISFVDNDACDFAKYYAEQLSIHNVSNMLCGSFDPDTTTSSATKCKCGREKWEHPKAT
ncbi:MAG TPA: hypothetical protein GX708_15705 [Gallicola sp.]|nr:hypothetical protein [Gallicola sp.]